MLYKEITATYCVNRAKHNKLCGHNKISHVRSQSEQQLFALPNMSLAPTTYFREIESRLFINICRYLPIFIKVGKNVNLYEGPRVLRLLWLQS
jgi:hypothetical protein